MDFRSINNKERREREQKKSARVGFTLAAATIEANIYTSAHQRQNTGLEVLLHKKEGKKHACGRRMKSLLAGMVSPVVLGVV
jgi:hypothetical protein